MWQLVHVSNSLQGGAKQQFPRHVPQQQHSHGVHAVQRPSSRKQAPLRATTSDDAANSSSDLLFPIQDYFHLGSGDTIPMPQKRPDVGPLADFDREEAICVQLKALQANDQPRYDHGIEVMYRFANFDPFQRSRYFGKNFDLGQFERFRRIMHIPAYKPLLNHDSWQVLSTLKLSEHLWKTRLHVVGEYGRDEAVYEITMVQRLGGRYGKHI
eukprot:GHRQ01014457.1.p1 GENE.GHRQ01014457.1~~GHRQ01014457.1.p1  ORF type:complete len:212 (+),score=52.46 GHRQ01014457.1:231-866(+)